MKIEIFIDERSSLKCNDFRVGFYIVPDNEECEYTVFGSQRHSDYDAAKAEAYNAAGWLFPGVPVSGLYPAPGMVEGDLRTT